MKKEMEGGTVRQMHSAGRRAILDDEIRVCVGRRAHSAELQAVEDTTVTSNSWLAEIDRAW